MVDAKNVNIIEIFSSIQGEGKYVGCRQIFVRFAGCNASCRYCDTWSSRTPADLASIEVIPGVREFITVKNPITVQDLFCYIQKFLKYKHQAISFTGGEPLCHADALALLLPKIKITKYLETNGTLPNELVKVIKHIDIISMDIKLPSITGREYWDEHYRFLQLAKQQETFVKIVISGETQDIEFNTAIDLIAAVDRNMTVILQPITPINGCSYVSPERTILLQDIALKTLNDVRVIPQTHKFLKHL